MTRYIITRIIHAIPLLLGITLISFFIMQMAPGDYFTKLQLNPEISKDTMEQLRLRFGFDKPLIIQYFKWLSGVIRMDLGNSFVYQIPVSVLIKERLFNTLLLSIVSIIIIWFIAIPLGILCATHRNKWIDIFLSGTSFIGISIPSFFLAFLLLYAASTTGFLPTGGITDAEHSSYTIFGKLSDYIKHLIIPSFVIALANIAGLMRIMRSNMLDEINQPYTILARAKGLSAARTTYKHVLRNAINPLITIFGYQISGILSGAALTEIILSWPGMGKLMLDAILQQDLYLVMANLFISSMLLIVGNLFADVMLAMADPRIRK